MAIMLLASLLSVALAEPIIRVPNVKVPTLLLQEREIRRQTPSRSLPLPTPFGPVGVTKTGPGAGVSPIRPIEQSHVVSAVSTPTPEEPATPVPEVKLATPAPEVESLTVSPEGNEIVIVSDSAELGSVPLDPFNYDLTQSNSDLTDQSNYDLIDQSHYDLTDQSNYDLTDQSNSDLTVLSNYYDLTDQSNSDVTVQSDYDLTDQSNSDLTDQSGSDVADLSKGTETASDAVTIISIMSPDQKSSKSSVDCEENALSLDDQRMFVTLLHDKYTREKDKLMLMERGSLPGRKVAFGIPPPSIRMMLVGAPTTEASMIPQPHQFFGLQTGMGLPPFMPFGAPFGNERRFSPFGKEQYPGRLSLQPSQQPQFVLPPQQTQEQSQFVLPPPAVTMLLQQLFPLN